MLEGFAACFPSFGIEGGFFLGTLLEDCDGVQELLGGLEEEIGAIVWVFLKVEL